MSSFEQSHPRGADGRWTTKPPSPPAALLQEPEREFRRLAHPQERPGSPGPLSQAAIDHAMNTRGHHLGPDDEIEVRHPGYDVSLPETPARVTVRGGSVCRTPDSSQGNFAVRDRARLIAHGNAHAHVYDTSSVDIYDEARADLHNGSTGHLYSPRGAVRARNGATVYAWAGTVRAEAGATVWLMGPQVTLEAAPGTHIGDGADSPLERVASRPLDEDIFERHRLNAETGAYDPEPGDRQ